MENKKSHSKASLSLASRVALVSSALLLGGCASIKMNDADTNFDTLASNLPESTPSCDQKDMLSVHGLYFSFLFNQNSTVGVGDTTHRKAHILAEAVNDEYCGIVAANDVQDVFLEEEMEYQVFIDAFMKDIIDTQKLEDLLFEMKSGSCWRTDAEVREEVTANAQFYEKAKADGVRVHFIDPENNYSQKYFDLYDQLDDMDLMGNGGCDAYNADYDNVTSGQLDLLNEFLGEGNRLRALDDVDILDAFQERQRKGINALIIYGAGHFDDAPYSLANVATSAGFYYDKDSYIADAVYNNVNTDYALINDGTRTPLMTRTDLGKQRNFPDFSY